jgi:hypothetical protein
MKKLIKNLAWLMFYIGVGGLILASVLFLRASENFVWVKKSMAILVLLGICGVVGFVIIEFGRMVKAWWQND